jgi:hypothetical protein
MRMGKLEETVYKEVGAFGTLRQLARTHTMIVQDTVRTQNRINALFRSRGVSVARKSIYASDEHDARVAKHPASGAVRNDDAARRPRRGARRSATGR